MDNRSEERMKLAKKKNGHYLFSPFIFDIDYKKKFFRLPVSTLNKFIEIKILNKYD